MEVLTHVLALFTWIIGPLIVLLASEDESAKNHARMALNWQISFGIYVLVSIPLVFVFVGFLTIAAVNILNLVFCIIAAVKASDGKLWSYPVTIPFLKQQ